MLQLTALKKRLGPTPSATLPRTRQALLQITGTVIGAMPEKYRSMASTLIPTMRREILCMPEETVRDFARTLYTMSTQINAAVVMDDTHDTQQKSLPL